MILFVVNDAGPAKYISYILERLDKKQYICLASNISSKVFDEFNIDYLLQYKDINFNNIKLIITGTCLDAGIDKDLLQIGKQNNIKTISIIEHWSLYKKRFELNGECNYPDIIFLNDEIAKQEAIKDGLDKKNLKIVGNPVFENIVQQNYNLDDKNRWKRNLQLNNEKRVITFISEEYKKDFPIESDEYPGFDEFEVVSDLIENLTIDDILIIKLHPAEDKSKYGYLEKYKNIKIIRKVDIDKLIVFSDVFIGMGSMLLLEASFLRDSVYSYRPNEKLEFIGNINGMTIKLSNEDELKITSEGKNTEYKILSNKFINSTQNILNIIQENIR